MIRTIKQGIVFLMRYVFEIIFRCIPVSPNTILFIAFHGRGECDNPKAIFLAMKKDPRFAHMKFIWAIKKNKLDKIDGAKVIPYFSLRYFYYIAHSKYWICNCKLQKYIVKKPQQIYLQTWHGTPLKRLAHDIQVDEDTSFYRSKISKQQMEKSYDDDVKKYTYMISPNAFCTEVFQTAFHIEKDRLIETGYPRNDILTNYKKEDVLAIKAKWKLPQNKKIILYAPTWRDNQFNVHGYTFTLKVDFLKWKKVLGDTHIVIFKPHYLISHSFAQDKNLKDFVFTIDSTTDIAELYVISDCLITDYSSVFFDYAILKRPIYFYMYDIDTYAKDLRGLYLTIPDDLPGECYEDESALITAIKQEEYNVEQKALFTKKFLNKEDGHASERVLEYLAKKGGI